ncbi:MAG TPA: IPT/TIG domain-containing protein [Candidatus Acidoferrales bacterium]|nr:IPT/TIG domain-containing protein [Candidatus Acidoferrales bacterium]
MLMRMCFLRPNSAALLAIATVFLAICGCGGSTTNNPTPQITGLIPPEMTAGSQSFTLFVSGTQFISTTTVQWNGTDVPTAFNTASGELLAAVPAADVQTAGIAQVTVTSPAPGGGRSLAVAFTINSAGTNGPTITSLSPSSAALNGAAFTLTVNGTNFAQSDYVTWNGGIRTTAFVSSTQLTANILASDLTVDEVASVAVHTSQLGVASPSAGFQVGNSSSGNVKFPQLVSVPRHGSSADGQSSSPAISDNGRYVAFYSSAKNLVAGGAAGNIFLRDTCAGQASNCTPGTNAVDVAANGTAPNGAAANHIAISADGRYVAFTSSATNLTSEPLSGPAQRVFVRDTCVGATSSAPCSPKTEVASVEPNGNVVNASQPSISADGRFVAFTVPGGSFMAARIAVGLPNALMVRDTCHLAGKACTPRTVVASGDGASAVNVDLNAASAISSSGRYVAFVSAGKTTPSQIYLRDTCLSADSECVPSTVLVSVAPDGRIGNGSSGSLQISGDGRFVVFESAASNLADGSATGEQIYLRDTCAGPTAPLGCAASTTQISGKDILSRDVTGNYSPSISPSGRYISYLVRAQDNNAESNSATTGYILVYDTCFGATGACSPHAAELVAADPFGNQAPLTSDIRVPVPVTDAGFAAFFTQQAMPAVHASGLGDVFLTTTPFLR